MRVVYDERTLLEQILQLPEIKGTLIDEFIDGLELEVDCISDGEDILMPGIMEPLEQAGIHSGDSVSIYPLQNIKDEVIEVHSNNKIKSQSF